MSLKFTRKDNPDCAGTNPPARPVLPPPDLTATAGGDIARPRYDQKDIVAGARALIDAVLSGKPEDLKFIDEVVGPAQDDLDRMDVLMSEGCNTDEAWAELDRIKRAAGK